MAADRASLPIYPYRDELLAAVEAHQVGGRKGVQIQTDRGCMGVGCVFGAYRDDCCGGTCR
jgi:hypothetical protein